MRIGYGLEFHKSDFDAQGLVIDAKRKSQHCFSRSAGIISSEMEINSEMTSTLTIRHLFMEVFKL